ncbi:midasin isoform X2 [Galleria mellonella]|uniref:Midasin n=1 Tax=Galleria mellonella TaxID=7137 RepID=A0ABM3MX77_GALME|nr:midasin isoform X2 [Galleria mellonella]
MVSNILAALKCISSETNNKEFLKICCDVVESLEKNSIGIQNIIQTLSEHILKIENALLFKKYLSNILLALVSARIPLKPVFSAFNTDTCSDEEKTNHLEYSIVLAALSDHPDVLQYALKYFEINPVPPFMVFIHHEESYNVAPKKRRLQDCRHKVTDQQIVTCCYTLLSKLPNELSSKWDWTQFVTNFSNHENTEIRWMVKECMAILTNMTEAQTKILSKNLDLSEQDTLQYTTDRKCEVQPVEEVVTDAKLNSSSVVNIDGIMLPLYNEDFVSHDHLVPVKSTINNLRSLALAVASGKALCLMGPVGSGKTSLVEYLAAITGRKGIAFKKVQLGDQTDSRMLLGSHQCTDIPGEFVWRPGVLTEAVQNGHWLLLEDIDCAALDVVSTLSSLLERNALCVPGYRDSLPVTPGFQLFVTQRTLVTNYGFQKKMSNSSALLQKHLTQINVEPLSRSELGEIIQTLYPRLSTISSRIIEVFMMFSVGSHDTSLQTTENVSTDKETNVNVLKGSRLISTRDLMKWCSRSVVGFEVSSPDSAQKVLQNALDIFTSSISSPEHRLQLAKKVGTCLGIVEAKTEFYCKHYKPNVSLHPNSLEVGRANMPRIEKALESVDFDNKQAVFSFTRQTACLLEKIMCCVTSNEPVLLVGETGTGKTSSVQYLAKQTGHKLVVINMNQQSDSADLLGGYKPVDLKYVIRPIKNEFERLFRSFYNVEKNQKFLGHIDTCYERENWTALLALMKQSYKAALTRLTIEKKEQKLKKWVIFGRKLSKLEQQIKTASRLTFAFIEGSLVKAMQEGHWVLLDEINLASAEILECLAGLLEDKNETIDLLEKGDKVPIKRHPNFTLFACMNPATDVGKKDLPVGLRNRFTEFFIDELTERNDLMLLIGDYLYHMNLSGAILESIYSFYANVRKEAKLNLVDGAGNAPHYSLRTLCRALTAAAKAKCGTVARSLYEAFCLSFLTQLDSSSHPIVEAMIAKAVIGKKIVKSILNQLIPEPQIPGQNFLLFEGHWIPQGKLDISIPEGYILTPTVRKNLRDIARIISLGRLPILLQGDTSVGKTSLITYIARASGNYCVRINNHEHTDLQEYIGSYASDANGKLVFQEGILVEAMRKGHWIILDELNLAPSDVLEALNRVLDDNRELFIPETQQVVKADPNFMLFATQNPPGLYGGRKMLSRAFRNRFVELHFDEIPRKELETILHQRCHVPPAYSKKMIAVMAELQVRRRGSAAVQGKDGFITLRDLFRWGQRYKHAAKEMLTDEKFYDWDQHIADEGYLILAGKVRQTDERTIIEEVIEKHIKRKVSPNDLFSLHQTTSPVTKSILETIINNQLKEFSHVVWTYNMRRLAVLIAKAFTFDEPVLLVGETGCGKTTICQVLATLTECKLLSVNCHMHTESSDFLGGLRPVRQYKNDGRLFEWVDGPLIKAMQDGDMFLADEISLADDSVLERLNSLLEPERQLVLSEKAMEANSDIVVITAHKKFHIIGTMNPGGDFGKKELSPALRNRFTEIWCDNVSSRVDLLVVLEKSVSRGISLGNQEDGSSGIGSSILDFTDWLKHSEVTNKFPFSIRDLLSWVNFINATVAKGLLDTPEAYVHGACMTFLDCFGTALTGHIDSETLALLRKTAINFLLNQIETVGNEYLENLREMLSNKQTAFTAESDVTKFGVKPFYIEVGPHNDLSNETQKFTFTAPTTGSNTLRLLRGLQLNKAILLEGNPGVGKTSLVTALAKSSGHKVVRINLSDQTDITDLFGTDLPTEDGSFTFKEGAFLNALQNGDWILLDELNLAPQPVLEGLNACLDHRGEVYIPELSKTFKVKAETRLFACQNPLKQGGARRGLPISFLNRFTQVYIDTLTKEDLMYIVESQYPTLPNEVRRRIVEFNCKVAHEITELQSWGHRGGPWEMNLRDIQRWCDALIYDQEDDGVISPGKFVDMLYINRMRTAEDKEKMLQVYNSIFYPEYPRSDTTPQFEIHDNEIVIGDVIIRRNMEKNLKNRCSVEPNYLILRNQLSSLKALAQSVKMNWLSILVGPTATGKSSIVQILADLTGNDLQVIPVTSAMDVSDLLGGFEQVDLNRNLENVFDKIERLSIQIVRNIWLAEGNQEWKSNKLLTELYIYKSLQCDSTDNEPSDDINKLNKKTQFLLNHCEKLAEYNKAFYISVKLQEIVNNLKKLASKLSLATSVNAGGKFEWVDSLLVKTMIEGSWLLLDNVNLTSAAVLDRLNGLLEPNGVLSVPERGETSEIKPHPNFRIFFTMDPKYGEISRAMRNRGVEIFLLRSDELNVSLTETVPYMDLTALLLSCGLPQNYHDICIQCHELMASFIQGFERPTISHLLQASHLTSQQLVRAIPFKIALVSSFADVYIKPRCGGDFASNLNTSLAEIKNSMVKALQNKLDQFNCNILESHYVPHTLTVKGLCKNSSKEITKQIAYVVLQQITNTKSSDLDNLLYSLLALFTAYQKCPYQDLYILHDLIKNKILSLNNNNHKEVMKQKNDELFEDLSQCQNGICALYKRFYPESYILDENFISSTNIQTVLTFNKILKSLVEQRKEFSAIDYSIALRAKNLSDDFPEYPILSRCRVYLDTIDYTIIRAIQFNGRPMDDKTACHILQLLNWRRRFANMCSIGIFITDKKGRKTLNEEIVKLLYVHSKWLEKHLFGVLLNDVEPQIIKEFSMIIESIMLEDDKENSVMNKLTKKLRKLYNQPKLYKNQGEYDLCVARSQFNNKLALDLNQPLDRQLNKLSTDVTAINDLSLAFDVPDKNSLMLIEENVIKTMENINPSSKVRSEIKLLPLKTYILQRVLCILRQDFLKIFSNLSLIEKEELMLRSKVVDILINVIHISKTTKGLSPTLVNMLVAIEKLLSANSDELQERLSSLPVRFWDEFYRALVFSPAFYPLAFFDASGATTSDDIAESVPTNGNRMSANLPLLPYYVQKLTLSVNNEDCRHMPAYETVSLEDRANYSIQLDNILNIIFKNIVTLDTIASLKIKSNLEFEINKYEQLLNYLHSTLTQTNSNEAQNTDKVVKEIIEQLQMKIPKESHYSNLIVEAENIYKKIMNLLHNEKFDFTKMNILIAQLSLLTSILFTKLLSEIKPVDHVEKHKLKLKYIEEDIKLFDALLSTYYIHGVVTGSLPEKKKVEVASDVNSESLNVNKSGLIKVHPYCAELIKLKEETAKRVHKYALDNTFRPETPSYSQFVMDCKYFKKSILSPKTTQDLTRNLINISNTLLKGLETQNCQVNDIKNAHTIIKETTSWLFSVNAFYNKLQIYSEAFPDLAKLLQSSISQIVYSVTSLNDLIRELTVKIEQGPVLMGVACDLLVYPNFILKDEKKQYLERFITNKFRTLLSRNIVAANEISNDVEFENIQVLKMNLAELKIYYAASERVDEATLNCILLTLNMLVEAWQKQQQQLEQKKQDEEALYVTKSKCEDENEEEMAEQEIIEMFPSYSDTDFGEFKPPTLEQKTKKTQTVDNKQKLSINQEDVSLVYEWHSMFVRNVTRAEWLPCPKKLVGCNVVNPLLQRYPTFSRIMQNTWEALDAPFERFVTPSLMILVSQIKAKVDGNESSSQKMDFYRSAWVSETRQCVPLLYKVKEATNELLDQWPDFPTLKDIMVIVNRILSFPLSSPVSRLLTGLELLRDKIEEWNKNAHKGNNMIDISLAVGQQIVNWRKLEMSHWKECLNNLYDRKRSEAHKYWFYMYSVVTSYLDTDADELVPPSKVTSVLNEFMEKSNLVEYEVRLDIIYAYHCHLVHLEPSDRRDELLSILWNTYNYYSQFSAQITAHLKEKRAPIEKKLRDFVKICTWDRDLSYWSVKDTVEKAHKALHKQTKEFENVLKESVTSCLVDNSSDDNTDHVGIWDRPKRAASAPVGGAYMIDVQNFLLLTRNIKKYLDNADQPSQAIPDGSLLSKVTNLLNKAKTLCKDTMTNSSYPSLVQGLDDFVTLVIETSTHLGSLEVDSTLPKEKQTSQAKSIIQQKRKALADLFKYLSKMGLNYRTGLVILASNDDLYDFTIPPVDLDAAMQYLKNRRCDASLSLLWLGCEKYFQKNIARHRLLTAALLTPHKDLGIQNIERCKGFAAQLLKLTNTQKKSISKYSRYLSDLRTVTTNLTNALEISTVTNISTVNQKLNILAECYTNIVILLEQFSVLLKSCPERGIDLESHPNIDAVLSNSPIVHCYKNNDEWHDLNKRVKFILLDVNKQKTDLNKLTISPKKIGKCKQNLPVISQSHVDIANEAKTKLEKIANDVKSILQEYQIKFHSEINKYANCHPMMRSIVELEKYLIDTISLIDKLDNCNDVIMEEVSINQLTNKTEDLLATMLLIIQSMYKKHLPQLSSDSVEVLDAIDEIIDSGNKEKEESKDILEDNHLKELLQENLTNDGRMLQLETLINKTNDLLRDYLQLMCNKLNVDQGKYAVMKLVPILEQTVLFVQYFVTQKVAVHRVSCKMLSVLLKIFSDLAAKGFCKPSDLDTEEGEGDGGPGKLTGGVGLGDGEGQKDISERIENQDQLDDAHRPGEEKKEEERDCKEEEKGINMSDDFDSHLQDVEQKGNDSEQEDDEDDADKQMGETDNAAEKLDQQIWGSEDEDDLDEEQNNTKDKEEKGKGESTGEKEISAKEEEQGTDDGEKGKEKQKKKDINEMEEPEIDDDHVDPYHGKQQPLPEPEDFEMPDNMDVDGDERDDDIDGETETENPFDIPVIAEDMPDDKEDNKEEEKDNKNGLEVSSDEEDGEEQDNDQMEKDESDKPNEDQPENTNEEENQEGDKNDEVTENEDQGENLEENADEETPDKPEENLPKNPDDIDKEDETEQKNLEANPQANPSNNDPSAEDRAENAEMDRGTNDNVETNAEQLKDEEAQPKEQAQEQVGDEKQLTGRSELDKSDKGHRGEKQAADRADTSEQQRKQRENKPGSTDHERTLGNVNEKKHKQMHTLNVEREEQEQDEAGDTQDEDKIADAYQHVKQAQKDDMQALDAATKEQADQQPTIQQEEEEGEKVKEDEEVPMEVDDDDIQIDKSEELKPEKMKNGPEKDEEKSGKKKEGGEEPTGETGIEVEGEQVVTANVPRGKDTTYHTKLDDSQQRTEDMTVEEYMSIREWVQRGSHQAPCSSGVWRSLWHESAAAARALCERLRLVLEPTGRSRRAGDFRTGRAINMRRVIPYIASQFRKDRIWLRRTKPAKREYSIAIAIDDSSSMADNRSKELAFESLALVSQALNLLESGDLAVLSFGEKPNLLHPFTEQFSEHSGSKILEQLRFEQTKTKIAQLLDFCSVLFEEQTVRSDAINAKLLVIVSDGRGIFSEGETRVVQAVRRARQQGIFLVYVIIDNPDNKDSIMDIRRPLLDPVTNSLAGFIPYLDTFPFPFYLILRDMSALPTVLGDALRQWFELAANTVS